MLLNEIIPFYLKKLDRFVKDNGGYFALNRITWADIYFVGLLPYLENMAKQDITADWENLRGLKESIESNKGVKKWNSIPRKLDCGCP